MADGEAEGTLRVHIENNKIKKLKKEGAFCKMKLTLYKKLIASLDMNSLSADQRGELKMRTDRIILVFQQFDDIQSEIETLADNLDLEIEERENFENNYYLLISKVNQYVEHSQVINQSAYRQSLSPLTQECLQAEAIKYPEIPLPSFSGEISLWLDFRDSFDAIINKGALKPIQKYKYLKACLSGSAL